MASPPNWRIGHILDFAVRSRKNFETYEVQVFIFLFFIPFTVFALLFSPPPSRNLDPGSHIRLFSPADGGLYLRNVYVRHEGRAQIAETNRN